MAQGRVETRSYHFRDINEDLQYALFVPSTYDPCSKSPLVVLLHGALTSAEHVMQLPGITSEAEKHGYIVVAPSGYSRLGWYGIFKGSSLDGQWNGNLDNFGRCSEQDVMNVLTIIRREYNVDEHRIYLMGHSMGGAGTFYLGARYPKLWAALAPISPALYFSPSDILAKLKRVPLMIVTGDKDIVTPVAPVREIVEIGRHLGMNVQYHEIEGAGHLFVRNSPQSFASVFDFFGQCRRPMSCDIEACTNYSDETQPTSLPASNVRNYLPLPCKRRKRRSRCHRMQHLNDEGKLIEVQPLAKPDMVRLFCTFAKFRLRTIFAAAVA